MLDDLALRVHTEDVDPSPIPILVGRPLLMAVKNHVVSFSYDPLEVHPFARILPRHPLKVLNEGLLAIRHMGIVLDVSGACVMRNCVGRPALIEHEIVERNDVALVTL